MAYNYGLGSLNSSRIPPHPTLSSCFKIDWHPRWISASPFLPVFLTFFQLPVTMLKPDHPNWEIQVCLCLSVINWCYLQGKMCFGGTSSIRYSVFTTIADDLILFSFVCPSSLPPCPPPSLMNVWRWYSHISMIPTNSPFFLARSALLGAKLPRYMETVRGLCLPQLPLWHLFIPDYFNNYQMGVPCMCVQWVWACVFTHLYRGAGIYLGLDQCHYGGGVVSVVGMSFL